MKQYCAKCAYSSLPSTIVEVKGKEFIFMENDTLNYVYQIVDGLVKVSKLFPNGEERIFDILGDGDYIGLLAALKEESTYIANAVCLTDVTLKKILVQDVLTTYQSNNEFKDTCMSCAVTRTNLFQSQLFTTTSAQLEDKIMIVLQYLTKKFGTYSKGEHVLDLPFGKTTLASIVGVRRETLSRKLSSMQQDNVIRIEKNKYYFDRM